MYLDKLHNQMLNDGYELFPASQDDIVRLTQQYGKLPKAYIEFMAIMGNGTNGSFFRGASCFTDEIFYLNEWGRELLSDNDSAFSLKNDDFVFWMSQGCMFCYFNLKDGDNPAVYFYTEINPHKVKRIARTFSEFLILCYKYPYKFL